jgi:hypothetical protein
MQFQTTARKIADKQRKKKTKKSVDGKQAATIEEKNGN